MKIRTLKIIGCVALFLLTVFTLWISWHNNDKQNDNNAAKLNTGVYIGYGGKPVE